MYPEHGFYMTPLSEGLRAAGTVELGGLDRPHRPARCVIIAQKTRRFLPGLGEHTREWLGFRPSMPDSLPVIGPSPRDPRVVYAFGHGHVGVTLAGITGRVVADLISGLRPPLDIAPLRADRFGDGLFS
jgi:D-amino-acid dehydrogenase